MYEEDKGEKVSGTESSETTSETTGTEPLSGFSETRGTDDIVAEDKE